MRHLAFWLTCALAALGYVEPAAQTLAQQKTPSPRPAPAPPQKAPLKAPVAQADEDLQVQMFIQEYGPRFRLLYKAELHFLRLVCQPTKQQFEKIAADGEPALQATMRQIAATWRRPGANDPSDLHALIVPALVKAVRSTLSAEQSARYQKEIDQRAAAHKQAMVLLLVNKIDGILLLSAEQRLKLGEILQTNWNDSWNQEQWLNFSNRSIPSLPDEKIVPVLTETQKQVWHGISKGSRYSFNPGVLPRLEIDEEVWNDEQPQKNRKRPDDQAAAQGKTPRKSVEKK
jgi:hypothetical protein